MAELQMAASARAPSRRAARTHLAHGMWLAPRRDQLVLGFSPWDGLALTALELRGVMQCQEVRRIENLLVRKAGQLTAAEAAASGT